LRLLVLQRTLLDKFQRRFSLALTLALVLPLGHRLPLVLVLQPQLWRELVQKLELEARSP